MKAVFLKDLRGEMNVSARFSLPLAGGTCLLRLAAGSAFQVFVNGAFVCYGPLRFEHGTASVHTFDLTPFLSEEKNELSVLVAAYNNNSYYLVDEPAFFAAEVVREGKIVATAADFSAERVTSRLQKVQRYSYQRNFTEVYDFRKTDLPYPAIGVEMPAERGVELHYPSYGKLPFSPVERGACEVREGLFPYGIPDYAKVGGTTKGYTDGELETDLVKEVDKLYFRPEKAAEDAPFRYTLFDLGKNKTGFIGFTVEAETDTEVYVLFDEILLEEEKSDPDKASTVHPDVLRLSPLHTDPVNALKYTFPKGKRAVLSFEPYTMRYLKLVYTAGARITDVFLTLYENPDAGRLTFSSGSEKIDAVVEAARSTFSQNAVDMLTDCPSRERAGWLCDSFFTSCSEGLFTGDYLVERHFLRTMLRHNQEGNLPVGVLPMCYPADFPNGSFIPNWDLWLILQLKSYLFRTGDRKTVEDYRPAIVKMLRFFEEYENEDGLLEKLPAWVFVEWSAANDFVQDVNYPSNMLYAAALSAAAELYGFPDYAVKAENIGKTVYRQSFDGQFFHDHAVRRDGKLQLLSDRTETCQYYAIFFGIADEKRDAAFLSLVLEKFGPFRKKDVFPEIYPSNAFIGNYLRLEILLRRGSYEKVPDECLEYFYKMAQRTGTLWEHDNPGASCCHGFASKVACYLAEVLFGYLGTEEGKPAVGEKFLAKEGEMSLPFGEKRFVIRIKNGVRQIFWE